MSNQPGDIVDEDVLVTKDNRWSDDGVRKMRLNQRLFEDSFALEIGKSRCFSRVGDADVYYAPHTRFFRSFEECLRVGNGLLECERTVRKANPVGVIEGRHPFQAFDQRGGMIKVEGEDTHLLAKRMRVVRVARERVDDFSLV